MEKLKLFIIITFTFLGMFGCTTDDDDKANEAIAILLAYSRTTTKGTGLLYDHNRWSQVPENISGSALVYNSSYANVSVDKELKIPEEYFIGEDYLPTVGDQGNDSTCAAWAVGYGAMSIMQAVRSSQKPTTADRQFSPKYNYISIPDEYKESPCEGSYVETAFEAIQKNGIAPLNAVPYENLGTCAYDEAFLKEYSPAASNYKIESFRKIEVMPFVEGGSAEEAEKNIKEAISNNMPVAIGAKL